jgi:hypothetical protein
MGYGGAVWGTSYIYDPRDGEFTVLSFCVRLLARMLLDPSRQHSFSPVLRAVFGFAQCYFHPYAHLLLPYKDHRILVRAVELHRQIPHPSPPARIRRPSLPPRKLHNPHMDSWLMRFGPSIVTPPPADTTEFSREIPPMSTLFDRKPSAEQKQRLLWYAKVISEVRLAG